MADHVITGEVSNSKVGALFEGEMQAQRAADNVRRSLGVSHSQVELITSRKGVGRKLEPESPGIFLTALRAHFWLGLAGLAAGGLLFGILFAMGLPLIVNSAPLAAGVLVFFGGVAGLMFGGLVTLRPDHDLYILKVREGLEEGKYAVVVHARSHEQMAASAELLKQSGGDVIKTL